MPKQILSTVDDDSDVLRAIERDLRSNYGAEYRVIGSGSPDGGWIATLAKEIESATARIPDLVRANKERTYLDQTPLQNVGIVKSLETTLTILSGLGSPFRHGQRHHSSQVCVEEF